MKFFSYTPEEGLRLHATEDEAKARAQTWIDLYRNNAAEGWPEEVEEICWGTVRQQAIETDLRPATAFEKASCDYQLVDA